MSTKKATKDTKDTKDIHSPAAVDVITRKKGRMSMGHSTPSPSMKTRGIHINVIGKQRASPTVSQRASPTVSSKESPFSTPASIKSTLNTPGSRKRSLSNTPTDSPCFGTPVQVVAPKKRKVGRNNGSGEDNQNDYFCWLCHGDGTVVCCELCPRVYHTRCVGVNGKLPQDWVCPECQKIMRAECVDTRSHAMSMLTLEQRCTLLKFALQRMKHAECEPFQKPVDMANVPNYADYIFNPMDLTTLEKNIKKKLYGCTEAFMADTKWILHNCIIFNGSQHRLTRSAKMITKICRHEMNEIEVCPDCYLNSCMKRNDEWFCEICRNPHTVVWAKLKGYPFWPAKVLRGQDGQVDVRFFGAHDRSWIQVSQVFLYSRDSPIPIKNRRGGMDNALRETEIYIDKYNKTIGEFKYAAYRTPYDKTNVYAHTKKKNMRLKSLKAPLKSMSPVKLHKSASIGLAPGKLTDAKSMDRMATKKAASALKCKYNSIITTRRGAAALRSPDSEKHSNATKLDIISSVGLRKLHVGLTKVKLEKGKKGVTLAKKLKSSNQDGVFDFSNQDVVNEAKTLNIMETKPLTSVQVKFPDKKILEKVEKVVKDFENSLLNESHSDESNKDDHSSPVALNVSRLNLINNIKKEKDDSQISVSNQTKSTTDIKKCELQSGSTSSINVKDNISSDVNKTKPSPSISLTKDLSASPPDKELDNFSLLVKPNASDSTCNKENKTECSQDKRECDQNVSETLRQTKCQEKLSQTIESCREKLGLSKDEFDTDYDSDEDEDDDDDDDDEDDDSDEEDSNDSAKDKPKSVEKSAEVDNKIVEKLSSENHGTLVDISKSVNSLVPVSSEKTSSHDTETATSTVNRIASEKLTKEQSEASSISAKVSNSSDVLSKDTSTVNSKSSVEDAKVTGKGYSTIVVKDNRSRNKTDSPIIHKAHNSVSNSDSNVVSNKGINVVSGISNNAGSDISDKGSNVISDKAKPDVDPEEEMGLVMEVESESGLFMEVDTESDNELMIDLERDKNNDDDCDDESDSNSLRSVNDDEADQNDISEKPVNVLATKMVSVLRSSPSIITSVSGTSNSLRPIQPKPLQSLAQSVANSSVVLTSDSPRPVFVVVDPKGMANAQQLKSSNITVKSLGRMGKPGRVLQARQQFSKTLSNQNDVIIPQRPTPTATITKTINVPTSIGVQFRKTMPATDSLNSSTNLDLSKYADKLMAVVSETVKEMQNDISGQESYQNSLKQFHVDLEKLKYEHQQSMDELKIGLETTVNELRACWELQKSQLTAELRSQFVIEKQQAIEETKKKQWCAYCGKQAIFYCCWNTSYCDYPCQTSHWPEHMHTCSQSQTGGEVKCTRPIGQSADQNAKEKASSVSPGQNTVGLSSQVQRAVSIQQSPHKAVQAHHATDADKWKEKMRENLQAVLKRQDAEKIQERQRNIGPKTSSGPQSVGPMKVSTVDGQMYLSSGQLVASPPQIIPTPPPQQSPVHMQYLQNTQMPNTLGPPGGVQPMQPHMNAFHSIPNQQVTIPVGPQPGMPMMGQHAQPPMMQHSPMMQQPGGGAVMYPINVGPNQQHHRMLSPPGVTQSVLQNGQVIFTQMAPPHHQMGRPPTLPNMMMQQRPLQIQPRHF